MRMNSQKKEGEIIFEQLRLFQQNRDKKSILKEIIKQLESIKAASLDESKGKQKPVSLAEDSFDR